MINSTEQNWKDESLVKPLYVRVENMDSPRSNRPVANQYRIETDAGTYFQSYQTVIAFKDRATGQSPEEIADKMFSAIGRNARAGGRNAWMPYNPALKDACKKVGIKKDKELRDLFIN